MSDKKPKDYELLHNRRMVRYRSQINRVYDAAIRDFENLCRSIDYKPGKPFSLKDYPLAAKQLKSLINKLRSDLSDVIVTAVKKEWQLGAEKHEDLAAQMLGSLAPELLTLQQNLYGEASSRALKAFQTRRSDGLRLSDRVWNYSRQFKNEIELTLATGLVEGRSAQELSRDLKTYLKYPDKLFRRVRDAEGNLQLSKAAKEFHPGRGVYRSSHKNALRLAATETNIAYRTSDYTCMQQENFTLGIRIELSNNHTCNGKPFVDICDDLQGDYPKDFKWTGWHPNCRCHLIAITYTLEEFMIYQRRKIKGLPTDDIGATRRITDVPEQFKRWEEANRDRLSSAKSLPYFVRDNEKYFKEMLITRSAASGVSEAKALNDYLAPTS